MLNCPEELKLTQQWFAGIIGRAIDDRSRMNPISPSGQSMEGEAAQYILPSPTLPPHSRIEIYNQQYWWRLLGILHDVFPLVTRLFGYHDFNQTIGIPFLLKYPPDHWSLNPLGDRLPKWIREEYKASDKQFVLDAALLDLANNTGFFAREAPAFAEAKLDVPLKLQEHIYLFRLNYHLPRFRYAMLDKEPEYWEENDFPPLVKEGPYFFIYYRNVEHEIVWEEIEEAEHFLLSLFKEGSSIADACDALERHSGTLLESAAAHLAEWMQKWVARGWLIQ